MKKISLIITLIGLSIFQSTAQQIDAKGDKLTLKQGTKILNSKAQAGCLTNSGITVTTTGVNSSSYYTPSSTTVCNTPVVAFSGQGSWTGSLKTGFIKYTFNQPITCARVTYSAVNGVAGIDIGAITVDGGGILSLSNACGASVAGNVLTCNLTTVTGLAYGDVAVTVSSTNPFTTITLTNTGGQSGWVQGNPCNFILNDCETTPQENPGCCPGKNLICNGTFEETIKQCFESQYRPYSQQRTFAPGEYFITDYKDAAKLCKQWDYLTQAPCSKTGKGLFVNGATNGTGSKVIWQQKINFNGWAQYKFCADLIPLTQCCFNVNPKLDIKLSYQSGGQPRTVFLNQSTPNSCRIKYNQGVAQWESADAGTATLTITLDETGVGDGNDFILDNIALVELQPLPKTIQNQSSVTIAADLSINATFTGTLPPGVVGSWSIIPLDANGNPDPNCPDAQLRWWSTSTNFTNFDGCGLTTTNLPGKVIQGKSYRVYFATYGDCTAWDVVPFKVAYNPANKAKPIITKEEVKETPTILLNKLKGGPLLSAPTTSGGTTPRPK